MFGTGINEVNLKQARKLPSLWINFMAKESALQAAGKRHQSSCFALIHSSEYLAILPPPFFHILFCFVISHQKFLFQVMGS